MRKIERKMMKKNNNVDFNSNKKGGKTMFKTITKGLGNIVKNSTPAEKVSDKLRERKVAKIMKDYERKQKEEERIMDVINKMEREEREMQLEKDIKELEKLTGLSKEELDKVTVELIEEFTPSEETKKTIEEERKRGEEIKQQKVLDEIEELREKMEDITYSIFPVDPAQKYVGRFSRINRGR